MLLLSAVVEVRKIIHYCNQRILAIRGLIRRVSFKKVTNAITRFRHKHHTLPTTQEGPQMLEISHHHEPALSMCSEYTERPNSLDAPASEESESSRRSIARQRFKGAVRSVIMMQQQQAGQVPLYLRPFMPPRTPSFDRNSTAGMSPTRFSSIGLNTIRGQRVSTLIPKLRTLEPIQDLSIHTALVRHLQFSPNGKYLATSRCVMTSLWLLRLICCVKLGSVFYHFSCRGKHMRCCALQTLFTLILPRNLFQLRLFWYMCEVLSAKLHGMQRVFHYL